MVKNITLIQSIITISLVMSTVIAPWYRGLFRKGSGEIPSLIQKQDLSIQGKEQPLVYQQKELVLTNYHANSLKILNTHEERWIQLQLVHQKENLQTDVLLDIILPPGKDQEWRKSLEQPAPNEGTWFGAVGLDATATELANLPAELFIPKQGKIQLHFYGYFRPDSA